MIEAVISLEFVLADDDLSLKSEILQIWGKTMLSNFNNYMIDWFQIPLQSYKELTLFNPSNKNNEKNNQTPKLKGVN